MRLAIIVVMILCAAPALAQQPAKDRKDYLIEAFVSQRDTAARDAAACYADASGMIAKLQAEIAELKTKLEPKKED